MSAVLSKQFLCGAKFTFDIILVCVLRQTHTQIRKSRRNKTHCFGPSWPRFLDFLGKSTDFQDQKQESGVGL